MASLSKKILRILVVEDNLADTEMIRIYLGESKLRYQLFTADSLTAAFLILEDEDIDLTLLDFGLPDSHGFNTLSTYLERSADVPVVVMTGLDDQRRGTESVRAGAQDYLVKGNFDAPQLVKVITYSLERFRIQAKEKEKAAASDLEKNKLEELHQMTLIGTWKMDIVSNAMKWSKELFQIFDLAQNQFPPSLSDYLNFVHREDRAEIEGFFTAAIQEEEKGPIDHRILIDNRVVKRVSLRTRIKFDEKTNKVLLLGSVQDITRYRPQDESDIPKEESKLTTRDLLNQISFNIRTPLSSLVHLLYLMEKTNLSKTQDRLITDLKTAVDDLSFTLSNLVNLSILTNDKLSLVKEYFRPLDLLESIERVMNFKAQQNNRAVDMYIDPRLAVSVQGDSEKLGQLFFCMMDLAFLYSSDDAFIKVRCTSNEAAASDGSFFVQLEYLGEFPVWPEGAIDLDAQDVLQLIYPQDLGADRKQLLAAVFLRLCQQLNVKYTTNFVNNTVFFELEVGLKRSQNLGEDVPLLPQRALSILLVEDHPMQQIAIKQILLTWSEHVKVSVASNGKAALAKAKEQEFSIVLMDLQMPEMDGMTAATQLRQSSNVPIIALTASTSKQEEERCYQIGMNHYLAKPFKPEDLYRRIMMLVSQD